jgi:hypothetical protein
VRQYPVSGSNTGMYWRSSLPCAVLALITGVVVNKILYQILVDANITSFAFSSTYFIKVMYSMHSVYLLTYAFSM